MAEIYNDMLFSVLLLARTICVKWHKQMVLELLNYSITNCCF